MTRYLIGSLVLALSAGWLSSGALSQGASAICEGTTDKTSLGSIRICESPGGAAKGLQAQVVFSDSKDGNMLAEASGTDEGREMVCASISDTLKNSLPASGSSYLAGSRRLICNFGSTALSGFEQIAKAPPSLSLPEITKRLEQQKANTTPNTSSGPVKKLLARDLAAQTSKWDGQRIETTMSCFYADKSDYRCIGGGARIDISRVSNAEGREFIEDRCDTLTKSSSRTCNFRIVFVYGRYTTHRVSDRSEITLILPVGEVAELYPATSGRR